MAFHQELVILLPTEQMKAKKAGEWRVHSYDKQHTINGKDYPRKEEGRSGKDRKAILSPGRFIFSNKMKLQHIFFLQWLKLCEWAFRTKRRHWVSERGGGGGRD